MIDTAPPDSEITAPHNQSRTRSLQLEPVYNSDEAFVFKGSWTKNDKSKVHNAILGVDNIALSVLNHLFGLEKAEDEPSFTRCFYPANLAMVIRVFENVVGYFGSPLSLNLRRIHGRSTIQIWEYRSAKASLLSGWK